MYNVQQLYKSIRAALHPAPEETTGYASEAFLAEAEEISRRAHLRQLGWNPDRLPPGRKLEEILRQP